MNQVEQKLAAARTRLILDKPFLGALVLRLPLVAATGNWCTTSATDARSIYYNEDYIEPLTLSQVQFILAHEALHCGLSHFARRAHRDKGRWNVACDHAVNPLLVSDGLELPPDALYNKAYTGLSAEEIYPLIKSDSNEQTQDQHLYEEQDNDGSEQQSADLQDQDTSPNNDRESERQQASQPPQQGDKTAEKNPNQGQGQGQQAAGQSQQNNQQTSPQSGSDNNKATLDSDANTPDRNNPPPPLNAEERERLHTQWQQRLVGAVQQASLAGKMDGSVARLIQRLLRSTVPWRTLLARYMSGSCLVDYNILRPSQRRTGDAILPSLHARQTNVLIALDTSGSIEEQELAEFVAEVNAIKSLVNARVTLLACDSKLDENGPWLFEPWQQLTLPETLLGGGGTDFNPVFDWMRTHYDQLDLLIYFTDAQGRFPPTRPHTETLWLVKGSASVPWGQRIQLN